MNISLTDFQRYFNSIKVRLKLNSGNETGISIEFQFHKGTIKTYFANV